MSSTRMFGDTYMTHRYWYLSSYATAMAFVTTKEYCSAVEYIILAGPVIPILRRISPRTRILTEVDNVMYVAIDARFRTEVVDEVHDVP